MNILFIGAGKIATAIARGMITKGGFASPDITAVDISDSARQSFTDTTGLGCSDSPAEVIEGADVIILAVKPQHAAYAVAEFADQCQGKLIISIMAGITIGTLSEWFNSDRIVRIMPNTPLMIGAGASAYACGKGATRNDEAIVEAIFTPIGILRKMPEEMMDAVTALSGSGPGFIFEMIQAMVDAGVSIGFKKEDALELTVQTIQGAAGMVKEKMGSPDELRDAVTSPGGTTAAGLAILKAAGFRDLIKKVITAARDRSQELGKK